VAGYGKVFIVGVGPGDYKLMTLKAAECIRQAEVIVYDRLVGTKALSFAREDAEFIDVGKTPGRHPVPQEEINEILVKKAFEGKTVARVKGGDPCLFGRGGEEAEFLHERGIEFEMVPGVTSAVAVPAYAGIPVTHRDYCSSLHIITGHERPDKSGSAIDYEALARIAGTMVFLMGVKNLPEISSNLIKYGKDRLTPVAVIEKGTTGEQRVVTGTLAEIAGKIAAVGIKSPAVTVIGDVVKLREKLRWFPTGKLAGKRVLVTRAREQAGKLAGRIEELGGEVLEFPVIKIAEPLNFEVFDQVIQNLNQFHWLVFTSVNGVTAFFQRMRTKRIDIRNLSGRKLAAVGAATAEELNRLGLNADYVPDRYTTEDLLAGLVKKVAPGEKVLLARTDIANRELAEGLAENKIGFVDLVVYRTVTDRASRKEILNQIIRGRVDFMTFTSSATVTHFVAAAGPENLGALSKIKTVCIGPITARTASDLGLTVAATADVYTIGGLVAKLTEMAEER
jgi:uroporphyrinogen III methyltransferase/synthase